MEFYVIFAQLFCKSKTILKKSLLINFKEQGTGTPHFIVLHFIALCRYCIFYKLKVCGNPALSKSISAVFSKSIC